MTGLWPALARVAVDLLIGMLPIIGYFLGRRAQRHDDQQHMQWAADHLTHWNDPDGDGDELEVYQHARGIPWPHGYNPENN